MEKSAPYKLKTPIQVCGHKITHVVIGKHYKEKHTSYMTDELIIELVHSLDGKVIDPDSTTKGIVYYVADIEILNKDMKLKLYRLIWLFEGNFLEILGVINAYRVKKQKKGAKNLL